jgi:hypothetical protein
VRLPVLPRNEVFQQANPQPMADIEIPVEEIDSWKKSDCKRYEQCLDHAAKAGWEQFNCRACHIYEYDPDVKQMFADLLGKLASNYDDAV